jgi:hypothetical protein
MSSERPKLWKGVSLTPKLPNMQLMTANISGGGAAKFQPYVCLLRFAGRAQAQMVYTRSRVRLNDHLGAVAVLRFPVARVSPLLHDPGCESFKQRRGAGAYTRPLVSST